MALTRQQSVVTFSTNSGGQEYLFDVLVDSFGAVSVRNVRSPLGLIMDPYTTMPNIVVTDMQEAKLMVAQLMSETTVTSGTITFAGETSQTQAIASGLLNNTNYRVAYTTTDGMLLNTTGQTTTAFTVNAASAYGTVAVPITVDYTILVATQQTSGYSGTASIIQADAGASTVTFPTAMVTENYSVVLSPNGFMPVYLSAKSKTGFTIQLGYTMEVGETATVGFDVFV